MKRAAVPDLDTTLSANTIAILGLGLMGGSLALALRGRCARLLGVDPDPAAVELALKEGVVDQADSDAAHLLPQADVIVLAAPVRQILALLDQLPHLHPGSAMVIDLGSTKTAVVEAMERLPQRFDPVGGHPMCGKERTTLANAEAALYRGAVFALVPLARSSKRARRLAENLVRAVAANPLWLAADAHDRMVAATSHLPYLLSDCLAAVTPGDGALMIGPGFRSTARLAGTPPGVMLDVLVTNRSHILAQLTRFRKRLEAVETYLRGGDEDALTSLLEEGRLRYYGLLYETAPGGEK